MKPIIATLFFLTFCVLELYGQQDTISQDTNKNFKARQKTLILGGAGLYTAGSTALYFAWYKQNEQEAFHAFNDSREWLQMDKAGHIFSGYNQSLTVYQSFKWAGISDSKSIIYGSLAGLGFQTTIEVMDGFSSKWGFSYTDVLSNVVGVSAFYFQQKHWNEQKIQFKISYWPVTHSSSKVFSESGLFETTLETRADEIFGQPVERFLKDYNGQTIWISFNLKSFFPQSNLPKWLALSVGYSGENMYGGFENRWFINNEHLSLDPTLYPRYRQYILALDYDLSRVRTESPFLNTLLDVANMVKWPAPAIEYNRIDGFRFHLIFTN